MAEEKVDCAMFPPVTEVDAGPKRAMDSAQPLNSNNATKRLNIFFILPFFTSLMFKHRFVFS